MNQYKLSEMRNYVTDDISFFLLFIRFLFSKLIRKLTEKYSKLCIILFIEEETHRSFGQNKNETNFSEKPKTFGSKRKKKVTY